jgi:hypothetical protein
MEQSISPQYFDYLIDKIFKILPLYEEHNLGLSQNIDSLVDYELNGLKLQLTDMGNSNDFTVLLLTLKSISQHIRDNNITHNDLRREIFKSITLVKKMKDKFLFFGEA